MSRQYNPAIDAYKNMDIENMPADKKEPAGTGLLMRKSSSEESGLDVSNPLIRVAKNMQVIRQYRQEAKDANG
jgi:hypothetical protein